MQTGFLRLGILYLFLGMGSALPAQEATDPPAWPEFNFRRVTVPDANHQGPRITIQIAPPVPDATPAATPLPRNPHDYGPIALGSGQIFPMGLRAGCQDLRPR